MFTGLIEEIGTVKSVEKSGTGINITISANAVIGEIKIGDSVSIDGACQTVTEFSGNTFTIFASKVTAEVTTLGQYRTGRRLNLERAMSANSRFGGHIVQGHVDGKGKITNIKKDENGISIDISIPKELLKYIASKGSVSIDGISLTVVSLTDMGIKIYIIPETIKNTTLPDKPVNAEVNIEVDILAKYVEQMLAANKSDILEKDRKLKRALFEEGFM